MNGRLKSGFEHFDEPLPPYSSTTWGNDVITDNKTTTPKGRVAWLLAFDRLKQKTRTLRTHTPLAARKTWTYMKKARVSRKQIYALVLVLVFAFVPFIVLGTVSRVGGTGPPFMPWFRPKVLGCGLAFGTPQNSTVAGIEALFTLDFNFGKLTFAQAKALDIAWDLFVGRAAQLLAWWASYVVFSSALLRVIERHPTSYRMFMHIALEGPCLASMWALFKDLFRVRSKRTFALFFYMLLSTFYVLGLQTVLSALSGYSSTSIGWVSLNSTSEQIIPASQFRHSYIVQSAGNTTCDNICRLDGQIQDAIAENYEREYNCNCMLPNGTILPHTRWTSTYYYTEPNWGYESCRFNYTNNTQTYESSDSKTHPCTGANITLFGQSYALDNVVYTTGYCNGDVGYTYEELDGRSRCLPDTVHPSYQWGFSTMLSALFIIIHFIWSLTMYIVWQDAQWNSKLVKGGFTMTQLRAAFTLAAAAEDKMGIDSRDLVRANSTDVERDLHGGRGRKPAQVEYNIFGEDKEEGFAEELRRRRKRGQEEEKMNA